MIRLLLPLLAAAALLVLVVRSPADAVPSGFVYRNGSQLMLDGQPYKFSGLNIYNANSDGWCSYEMGTGSALDDALTSIGPGKNVIRSWFFQPLATDGGARNWSRFDHTLSVAAAHGYKVIVTMNDQWGDCGARGPDGELSYYKNDDWYASGYMSADPGMPSSYRDWVVEVVTRYKDSPTVLMWQLMNEAEVKENVMVGCLPGTGSYDILHAWTTDVSALIKSIDPDHLVSLGTIGGGQCGAQEAQYQTLHSISTIDVCEYHDYGYDAPIPGDQWNGLQVRIDQCNAIDKPLFMGETGVRPNDVGGTLQARASVIAGKRDAQMTAGIDGILAWAWSNLGSTLDNFDIGPADPVLEALILDDNCPTIVNPGQENSDGDAWGNACDQCPATATTWHVAAGDGDCDGFTSANEETITTNPTDACGFTAGGVTSSETWPPDLVETNSINISDVLALKPVFGTAGTPRLDIVPSGSISISDVLALKPFFGKNCTP